jgi:hypothetical protein
MYGKRTWHSRTNLNMFEQKDLFENNFELKDSLKNQGIIEEVHA